MGLILGPLILFWFAASIFSLRMAYVLLSGETWSYINIVFAVSLCLTLIYVFAGLSQYKNKKELYAFEIIFFFCVNQYAFLSYVLSTLLYLFAHDWLIDNMFKPLPFIVCFVFSIGTLIGTFRADAFMDKYEISRTH